MKLKIIAGMDKNNLIGKANDLPWHVPEDLKRFKELTLNKPVIMGRNTYESIVSKLGKPLPKRTNIVITSQKNYSLPAGVLSASSLQEAIEKAKPYGEEAYVIGGQKVYEQAINLADELEITHIHNSYEGDAYFPKIDHTWKEIKREDFQGQAPYSFVTYAKKKGVFIAFEGIDGCGKSTQIKKLAHHIFQKNKYNHVILTRNPYKDVSIRKLITEDDNPYSKAEKFAEAFIQDRRNHVNELVRPNLENGHFVITDRYKLSTICYQSAQGLQMEDLIEKQKDLPSPHMTFIVDVSPEIAKQRMQKEEVSIRGKEHRFEANLDFTKQLRQNYILAAEIMKARGERVFIINGERSPEEIFQEIQTIFDKEFN